ncbi:MAG: bifunctional demethylmenaquinone methyltransferase/2-methoxy-6-polyprenyl-1,4-benzoquinol methylase UbiE [Gammaproteobacteria bacterium]|nr:bifunctional demethylmenaquinone methyltransferase/2-methoxy-6-polyprenyl-1,4-benzoquinol methylase UbiE [Gammaproteobacteria bacterium]
MSKREQRARGAHFGYEEVPWEKKIRRVEAVFDSVTDRYDVMNDVMSLGIHRLWKRYTVELLRPHRGERLLDLAGGTGDLTARLAPRVGRHGRVVLSDINERMLARGRTRLTDAGCVGNIDFVRADAETLPFETASFDGVTMAFGLRNVTHIPRALEEIRRVLRPGGRVLILEFSRFHPPLPGMDKLYDLYSFKVLPLLGRLIARDAASYRYLAESIRMHPDQDTLQHMMLEAGLERCTYHNLSGGIVAVHRGYRL